jgi:hypothetical protein
VDFALMRRKGRSVSICQDASCLDADSRISVCNHWSAGSRVQQSSAVKDVMRVRMKKKTDKFPGKAQISLDIYSMITSTVLDV